MRFATTRAHRLAVSALTAALLTAGFGVSASAQMGKGPPNAVQGFSQNRNEPINITAVSLEVRDKEKMATFIDKVKVIQGDTTLECKKLLVFYDEEVTPVSNTARATPAAARPAAQGPALGGGNQQVRRLEAKGGVVVTQKDQVAVGDEGIYDTKTNSMTLIGNVIVTQGANVIKGDRLWVDLETGRSTVECKGEHCRVSSIIVPSQVPNNPAGKPPAGTPPGQKPTDKPRTNPNNGVPTTGQTTRPQPGTSERSGRQTSTGQPQPLNR
jgi:lipopolysaccharide export system protein LptA